MLLFAPKLGLGARPADRKNEIGSSARHAWPESKAGQGSSAISDRTRRLEGGLLTPRARQS